MNDVERLLAEYKEAPGSGGEADPERFLSRLSGVEREQLSGLIDAYLERAPRREFHAAALRDSSAAAVADSVQRTLPGSAGLRPVLLPRLRNQARIKRADLVAELAARLGAQSKQEKVASYYHEMEQGRLPASGVSDSVLEALGKIVGSPFIGAPTIPQRWSSRSKRALGGWSRRCRTGSGMATPCRSRSSTSQT